MVARVSGVILALIGLVVAFAGGGLALAMLGQPVPDLPMVRDLTPYLISMASRAPLPPGSDWAALPSSPTGVIALAGLGAGALIVLAGVVQLITGRRGGASLVLVALAVCGFAVAAAMA